MSRTNRQSKWSMIKFDLKTGLDVLKLPCLVKVADNTSETAFDQSSTDEITHGCEIKFEKEICICFVRARVLELTDVNWYTKKKGKEFVRSYSLMADSVILIPIEYGGKVKLFERVGGKNYSCIREVIEDFPRFVRVEKDTVCASPGIQKAQIVEKGTILELDRVTKSMQAIRGSRETYLICKDNVNSRQLAFRLMAPVQFTKVPDMTKDRLKAFVEHLPLPQTVEFVSVSPLDVISVDDDDARDVLVMLSGPLELLGLQMEHFVVGRVDDVRTNVCDIIAVPAKEHVLESFFVHLPVRYQSERRQIDSGAGEYVDLSVTDDGIYACLQQKLFLRYADDDTPLILRADNSGVLSYKVEEMPDTPPLPDKLDEYSLKHTVSAQHFAAEQGRDKDSLIGRKRFFSASDVERNGVHQRVDREQRGFKPFLSQLSRRMKSTASQILFGIEAFSGSVDQDLEYGGKMSSANRRDTTSTDIKSKRSGFVCYLDSDLKTVQLNDYVVQLSDTTVNDDVVYASVDVLKKNRSAIQVTYSCPVCREMTNTIQRTLAENYSKC